MALTDYIGESDILLNFQASGKMEALKALCRFVAGRHALSYAEVLKVVLDREASGSTGLGGEVALPHGKSAGLSRPVLTLALAGPGIEFDSLDGRPVRIIVLILSPLEGDGREHLQILARLGGLFKSREAVEELLAVRSPSEAYAFLAARA
ncbi:MAG: PTS sugar transporter subunit IIA [Candidatus Adiutrix sp.]|jgi:mannitol/fructose-specific phosphotransferase system IIA component (Ntr-type)|nr:PTS sugar transporter subunit IIA [Candidatus Adiutrix sp.]